MTAFESAAGFAVRHPVAVVVTAFALALVGGLSWRELPVDLLPDLQSPTVVVSIRSGNRPPTEMERIYGQNVERRLTTVRGSRDVFGVARTGQLVTTVTFDWDADLDVALVDVQKAVGQIEGDPEVDEVLIRRFDPRQSPILTLGLVAPSGKPDLAELRQLARRQVAPALEQLAGIAEARITGGRETEIRVAVDRYRLEAFGVSLGELRNRLANQNVDMDAGTLEERDQVFQVRGVSRYRNAARCRGRGRALYHRRHGSPQGRAGRRPRDGRGGGRRDRSPGARGRRRRRGRRRLQGSRGEYGGGVRGGPRSARRDRRRPAGRRGAGDRRRREARYRRPGRPQDCGRGGRGAGHPGARAFPAFRRCDPDRDRGGAGVDPGGSVRHELRRTQPEHRHPGWPGPGCRHAGRQRHRRGRVHVPAPVPGRRSGCRGVEGHRAGRWCHHREHADHLRGVPAGALRRGPRRSADRRDRVHRGGLADRLARASRCS